MTGASISLFRIIKSFDQENKYDVHAVLSNGKGPIYDLLKEYKVSIHVLNKKKNSSNFLISLWKRFIYFIKYTSTLLKFRPSIVYANTMMNIGEVIIASLMNIYTVVHIHEGKLFMQKYSKFIKLADYFTSEYIVVSEYTLNSLKKFTHKNTKKHVVYNGIEILKKNSFLAKKNLITNLSVIGTIDRNKSQLIAIQALLYLVKATSIKFHLNFFGKIADINYYNELLDYIKTNKLVDSISFHGEVIDQKSMYNQTDILLITSKEETFSLTALEAFNHSVPVIASNVGGLPEVVENNLTGLLFEYGDIKVLSKHVITLITNDLLKNQIIEEAYLRAKTKFNIDVIVQKISFIISRKFND